MATHAAGMLVHPLLHESLILCDNIRTLQMVEKHDVVLSETPGCSCALSCAFQTRHAALTPVKFSHDFRSSHSELSGGALGDQQDKVQ